MPTTSIRPQPGGVAARRGWHGKRVAIDRNSWFLTVNLYERLVAEFGQLLDGSGLVEPLRRVKSKLEIEQMEKAAAANDAGMRAGLDAVREGASRTTSPPQSWTPPSRRARNISAWIRS